MAGRIEGPQPSKVNEAMRRVPFPSSRATSGRHRPQWGGIQIGPERRSRQGNSNGIPFSSLRLTSPERARGALDRDNQHELFFEQRRHREVGAAFCRKVDNGDVDLPG